MAAPGVVFVWGVSDSGKTTLIERLLPFFTARGVRVGSIKHAHDGFDIDRPGKDSWRHAQAGANPVAVVGPRQVAWMIETEQEFPLDEVVTLMRDRVDLVVVEGFKSMGRLDAAATGEAGIRSVGAWCGSAGRFGGRRRSAGVLLEWRNGPRLSFEAALCRIGAPPAELTVSELERIAEFCLGATGVAASKAVGCSHEEAP